MTTAAEKERLLVVDDAKDTLEVLRRNLESQGYQVFTAPGVAEALKILEGTHINLVITDLKMPKVSGLDLIRHVRENLKHRSDDDNGLCDSGRGSRGCQNRS